MTPAWQRLPFLVMLFHYRPGAIRHGTAHEVALMPGMWRVAIRQGFSQLSHISARRRKRVRRWQRSEHASGGGAVRALAAGAYRPQQQIDQDNQRDEAEAERCLLLILQADPAHHAGVAQHEAR